MRFYPNTMPDEIVNIMDTWTIISQSPFSNSYYNTNDKSWDYTPEGSFRVSDHWNFVSDDGKIHCKTNVNVEANTWTLAQYTNGVYVVIKSVEFATARQNHSNLFDYCFKAYQLRMSSKMEAVIFSGDLEAIADEFNTNKSGAKKILSFAKKNEVYKFEGGNFAKLSYSNYDKKVSYTYIF